MLTGGEAQAQSHPQEIQIESTEPATQVQDLQWQPLQFQNFGNILRRDFLTVSMDNLIVIFSKVVSGKVKLSLLDPEKQSYHLVEAPTDPLSDLDKIVACNWEDDKIIVMGHKTTEVPGKILGKALETHIYLGIIGFLRTTDGFTVEHQMIPQSVIQTSSNYTPHYSVNIMKSTLNVIFGGHGAFNTTGTPLKVYRFDLETLKPLLPHQNITEGNIKSHTSFIYENDLYVYFKAETTTFGPEKAACAKLDTAGTVTSTTISTQNFLCSPEFQLQTGNGRIYGFANSPEKADYTTLHIYDIDGDNWEGYTIKGDGLDLHNKRLVALIGNQIYIISRSEGILCLDLSDLAKVYKKKPEVNLQSMEPLDRAALAKMFFKQAPYSDVIFEVESQLIPAHRWWLIKRSKYFANMFSSNISS